MDEREFQTDVMRFARQWGWHVRHFHDSRREIVDKYGRSRMIGDKDAAGWPDLTMWHPTRGVAFVELKGPKTPVTKPQRETLDRLAETAMSMCHGDGPKLRVHLWRPNDFVTHAVPLLRQGIGPIVYGWKPS